MQWQKFPATREDYYSMLDFVMEAAKKAGVPENRQIYLELGFEEAAANIINYAYSEKQDGEILIRAYREAEHFFVELKDSGVPFNPLTNIKDVEKTSDLEAAKVGGLGISFMRRVFDEMTYHFGRDGELFCNHLKLGMELSETKEGLL